MILKADRIYLLKLVSIFFETPDPILSQIADSLDEVEYKAGEMVFKKGDLGNSMFVIVSGRVRVHDGERTISILSQYEVFGEMAAIDPEPRSASVTVLEDTLLLRLEQSALFELMTRQEGVTRGIIHVLCQRLRARVQDMVEDFEYMQQFARVTAAAVALEAGIYDPGSLDEVARRSDELGQLARVFQRMVREVYAREQRLKQEVADLRIEIDEVRKARQVAEITDTDYFRELRQKANSLRATRDRGEEGPS